MYKIEEIFKNKRYYIIADFEDWRKFDTKFREKWYFCNHICECPILVQVKEWYEYEMFASYQKVLTD